jgi:glycosyltransferase involved in cell wall biosynthesis
VLLTHELFPPDFRGGGEYIAGRTAVSLRAKGVIVRVLTTGDPKIDGYEGVPTKRLPIHRYRFNFAVRAITESARDADLIHTFNYHACLPSLLAGRRLRKPVVCTILGLFRGAWREMRPPPWGAAWMAWERFLLTRAYDRVVFLSDYSREQGVALGVPSSRAVVHCPGIELERLRPAEVKEDVVLFASKLEVRKGVFDVLEAARALPHVRFRMIGWGPAESALRAGAPPNLEILSMMTGDPLRGELSKARVFLLPSRAETFGVVLAEAMASGCAIVSSVPLEFEGAHVPVGDVGALILALRRLWEDRPGTLEMGRRNRQSAARYSWERHAAGLLETYEPLLAGARNSQEGR